MRKPIWASFSMMIFLALLLEAGCAPTREGSTTLPVEQPFAQAALTQTTPIPTLPAPTIPPLPCDKAQFVADVTIPAGTVMPPGTTFIKTWRLKNVGDCSWKNTSFQVVFFGGEIMSASKFVPLPVDVAPGATVDISINMTAPLIAGSHRGFWMFANSNGSLFGIGPQGNEPWPVEINVVAESPSSTFTDTSTPTSTDTSTSTPTATLTDTPTLTPTATLSFTPTPTPDLINDQAVELAKKLAPQFSEIFNVQFDPSLAKGLDAARIGGPAGQLAGMIAPVINGNQNYKDRDNIVREVEGMFSLNDNRLTLETMIIINKANIQYPLLPLGAYMLACDTLRVNDCLAVSLQGEEFQIKPANVTVTIIDSVPFPTVAYEEGSIHKCFRVLRRKICVRVF